MKRAWLLVGVLACMTLLAACGRVGPPDPPGPPNEITWPKSYPTH